MPDWGYVEFGTRGTPIDQTLPCAFCRRSAALVIQQRAGVAMLTLHSGAQSAKFPAALVCTDCYQEERADNEGVQWDFFYCPYCVLGLTVDNTTDTARYVNAATRIREFDKYVSVSTRSRGRLTRRWDKLLLTAAPCHGHSLEHGEMHDQECRECGESFNFGFGGIINGTICQGCLDEIIGEDEAHYCSLCDAAFHREDPLLLDMDNRIVSELAAELRLDRLRGDSVCWRCVLHEYFWQRTKAACLQLYQNAVETGLPYVAVENCPCAVCHGLEEQIPVRGGDGPGHKVCDRCTMPLIQAEVIERIDPAGFDNGRWAESRVVYQGDGSALNPSNMCQLCASQDMWVQAYRIAPEEEAQRRDEEQNCTLCEQAHNRRAMKAVFTEQNHSQKYCSACVSALFKSGDLKMCEQDRCMAYYMTDTNWCPCGGLHDWNYRPPEFNIHRTTQPMDNNAPTLGIELEMELTARRGTRRDIAKIVNDNYTLVYAMRDGSLGKETGVELVFHPATLAWLQDNEARITDILVRCRDSGFRSWDGDSCGMHVHISKDSFAKPGGHRDVALRHKFLHMIYNYPGLTLAVSQRDRSTRGIQKYASLISEGAHSLVDKARQDTNFGQRHYVAVNMESPHTIEVRTFRGTLNPASFRKSVEFVHSLWEYCKYGECGHRSTNEYNYMKWLYSSSPVWDYRMLRKYLDDNYLGDV